MSESELSREEKKKILIEVMEGKRDQKDLEKYGIREDDDFIDDDDADELLKTQMDPMPEDEEK